jgi:hypothetical protein
MRTLMLVGPRCGAGTVDLVTRLPGERSCGDVLAAVDSGPVLVLSPNDRWGFAL